MSNIIKKHAELSDIIQSDSESDAVFAIRVASALNKRGKLIEAHEVLTGEPIQANGCVLKALAEMQKARSI